MRGLAHDYPAAGNDVGMSSSPAVIGNTVIVQIENQGDSFVAGIDTATGETRWRRSRKAEANWASPLAVAGKKQGDSYVLLQSPSGLTAHEPETGELLWHYEKPCSGIASPVAKDGTVYVAAEGLTALRPTREKRIPEVLWKSNRLRPVGPSAVVDAGHAYSVNGAILVCANTESGGVAWQRRLAGGRYWATPLLAGNHLYVINADGLAQVIAISGERRGEIIEENELGETILGSPAVSGGAIYLRSDQHLWKIGAR
jgi:outer membrane protein assembly factor BamB